MKSKSIAVLLVALAMIAGLAWWTTNLRSRNTAPSSVTGEYVLPNLPVNHVQKILFRGTDEAIEVAKSGDHWVAPGKYNYPVKFDRVRDFLRAVSDLKVGQVVMTAADTARERERMKLVQPSPATTGKTDRTGILVSLVGGNGSTVGTLLLGDMLRRSSPRNAAGGFGMDSGDDFTGRYVEAGGRICLVADTLSGTPQKTSDWLDDVLLSIRSPEISGVEVSGPGRDKIVLRHAPDGDNFTLEGMPADQELVSEKVSAMTGAFAYLRFHDVADPSLGDAQTGLDNPVTCLVRTREDRLFRVVVGKTTPETAGSRYARVSVEYAPAAVSNATAGVDAVSNATAAVAASNSTSAAVSNNVADAAAKAEEKARIVADIKQWNDKHRQWIYLISESDAAALLTERNALMKKKEEKKDSPVTQ